MLFSFDPFVVSIGYLERLYLHLIESEIRLSLRNMIIVKKPYVLIRIVEADINVWILYPPANIIDLLIVPQSQHMIQRVG